MHEGRRQIPDDLQLSFFFFLFFCLSLRIWLEDAGESLWYKICYSMYVLSPVRVSRTHTRFWLVEETLCQKAPGWSHVADESAFCKGEGLKSAPVMKHRADVF